jgi:hypothetical protein
MAEGSSPSKKEGQREARKGEVEGEGTGQQEIERCSCIYLAGIRVVRNIVLHLVAFLVCNTSPRTGFQTTSHKALVIPEKRKPRS